MLNINRNFRTICVTVQKLGWVVEVDSCN